MLHSLPRDWGKADQPVVTWILLLALLEDVCVLCIFPVNKNLPSFCPLSTVVEGGLAKTLASYFLTLGCILSSIWDSFMSHSFIVLPSPYLSVSLDAHTFHFAFLFSLGNFSFSWPLAFLTLFLCLHTMSLYCCFHLISYPLFSIWTKTGAPCSPMLAFCHAFLPSCTLERTVLLLWGDCPWKAARSPAPLCHLKQFPMVCCQAGHWRG